MNELNIVLSTNERYMPGATVALAGIALNAKPETALHFHVFTEAVERVSFNRLVETLTRLHPTSKVEEHVCDESILQGLPTYAGSRMAWVRCYYPRLLPDVDWALYIDCDILYLASPEEHFSFADDSVYACVTKDMSPNSSAGDIPWARKNCGVEMLSDNYFNSGVMLFNFKKFREDNIPEKITDFIGRHPDGYYADQTAMNVLFNGKGLKYIPATYNYLQIYLDDAALKSRPVIHYVNGIPWLPKLANVANGRYRLWHAFADKYVWQKKGESCRRLMPWWVSLVKRLEYVFLTAPVLCGVFTAVLHLLGKGHCVQRWKKAMLEFDISDSEIEKAL